MITFAWYGKTNYFLSMAKLWNGDVIELSSDKTDDFMVACQ